jgi:hypothetical protein
VAGGPGLGVIGDSCQWGAAAAGAERWRCCCTSGSVAGRSISQPRCRRRRRQLAVVAAARRTRSPCGAAWHCAAASVCRTGGRAHTDFLSAIQQQWQRQCCKCKQQQQRCWRRQRRRLTVTRRLYPAGSRARARFDTRGQYGTARAIDTAAAGRRPQLARPSALPLAVPPARGRPAARCAAAVLAGGARQNTRAAAAAVAGAAAGWRGGCARAGALCGRGGCCRQRCA